MKERVVGRVNGTNYEVVYPDGGVRYRASFAEAREDSKLTAAIVRNGWEAIPEE